MWRANWVPHGAMPTARCQIIWRRSEKGRYIMLLSFDMETGAVLRADPQECEPAGIAVAERPHVNQLQLGLQLVEYCWSTNERMGD